MKYAMIAIIIIFLLYIPSVYHTPADAIGETLIIRIAIIRQTWDFFDTVPTATLSTLFHTNLLKRNCNDYGYKVRIFEMWDSWNTGDIQQGELLKKNIDVIIAPGGVGGWYSPLLYRYQIRTFVRQGGSFYGICGDSTFGSLGVERLNLRYHSLLLRLLGCDELSPMLGLANVYTDASVLHHIFEHPKLLPKLDMLQFFSHLPTSRARVYFKKNTIPIQEPYMGKTLNVMLGNAPLIDGPVLLQQCMPKVYTIATFRQPDDPYDGTITFKKAIIATTYGQGRVILSPVHAEFTFGNPRARDVYIRNVLWLAGIDELPN
jgi:hypothetical protein